MLDPISILGATGFALEALQVLLKTGLDAYTTYQRSKDCQAQLNDYARALSRCKNGLREWSEIWQGFEDDTYLHFWGKTAFDQVQDLLSNIKVTHDRITRQIRGRERLREKPGHRRRLSERLLFRSRSRERASEGVAEVPGRESDSRETALRTGDWARWNNATLEAEREGGEVRVRDAGLGCRIAFALFQNELLQEDIVKLESRVEDLSDLTNSAFDKLRGEDGFCDRDGILATEEELLLARSFELFANELHKAYLDLQHECPWALELRVPDQREGPLHTSWKYHLELDFTLCLDGDAHGGLWRRVRVKYDSPVDPKTVARSLPRRMLSLKTSNQTSKTASVVMLGNMNRRSKPFRPLLQGGRLVESATAKAWEADRATLLLGLADWIVLMWNTLWSSVPCCCGIRFQELDSGARQYVFAVDKHEDCRGPSIAAHKLLQLGLTIAELLIGTSLRVPILDSDAVSRVTLLERWDCYNDPPMWVKCSRHGLLGDIKQAEHGDKLFRVVKFCLDNPSYGEGLPWSPDRMRALVRKVVIPIQDYCNVVLKQREATKDWKFWQQHHSAWPSQWLFEDVYGEDDGLDSAHLMPGSFPV